MSLFGHHHAAPTIVQRVIDDGAAILHLPLAFWLTVIPIAGGLAVAYVTHRLNLSRDRLALRREDERRAAEDERAAMRARAEVSFRLMRHRAALAAAARGDISRWEAEHDALIRRCAKPDVIDLLGKRYPAFMAVLQREEAELVKLRTRETANTADTSLRRTLSDIEAAFAPYVALFALADSALPAKSSG